MITETDQRCVDCGQSDGWLNDVSKRSDEPPLCNFCRRLRKVDR